ncbi:amidohydrolase family protein [Sphingobium algorifonticola]|uniref:amidohydrolase family protein n=1 Tax=Sphingobium algorifonticola TaxID=2008318 RepID=UPI0019CF7A08|nr:amidohydrolase family protein [Sphingobium algorifonticola]
MLIDAHQHFWDPSRGDYHWLSPGSPLDRVFGPADLIDQSRAHGVTGTILVQAAETEAETDYMIALARATPWVVGIVGWIDLAAPDAAARVAQRAGPCVGLRPMLQDMADREWILGTALEPALCAMADRCMVFDALVRPDQIAAITRLADRFPGLTIVIDHAGKPAIGDRAAEAVWRSAIGEAALRPNIACKLSGLMTEMTAGATEADLVATIAVLVDLFGPDRLIWGSDWPVLTLAGRYGDWIDLCRRSVPAAQHSAVFGANALRIYGIDRG